MSREDRGCVLIIGAWILCSGISDYFGSGWGFMTFGILMLGFIVVGQKWLQKRTKPAEPWVDWLKVMQITVDMFDSIYGIEIVKDALQGRTHVTLSVRVHGAPREVTDLRIEWYRAIGYESEHCDIHLVIDTIEG